MSLYARLIFYFTLSGVCRRKFHIWSWNLKFLSLISIHSVFTTSYFTCTNHDLHLRFLENLQFYLRIFSISNINYIRVIACRLYKFLYQVQLSSVGNMDFYRFLVFLFPAPRQQSLTKELVVCRDFIDDETWETCLSISLWSFSCHLHLKISKKLPLKPCTLLQRYFIIKNYVRIILSNKILCYPFSFFFS